MKSDYEDITNMPGAGKDVEMKNEVVHCATVVAPDALAALGCGAFANFISLKVVDHPTSLAAFAEQKKFAARS